MSRQINSREKVVSSLLDAADCDEEILPVSEIAVYAKGMLIYIYILSRGGHSYISAVDSL